MYSLIKRCIAALITSLFVCCLFVPAFAETRDDFWAHYDSKTLLENYTGDLQAYRCFLESYYTNSLSQFDSYDACETAFIELEMCRARNVLNHPYLAGYLDSAGEIAITGFKATDYWIDGDLFQYLSVPDVVIPDEIDGYPVTRIEEYAFSYHTYDNQLSGNSDSFIQSVVIGDNVQVIERGAFDWNPDLLSVTFGKNVEILRENAFSNCYSLKTIISWGENLREICDFCMPDSGLSSLPPLPQTIEYIGKYALCVPEGFVIPQSVERMHAFALDSRGIVILSRDMVIEETEQYPLNRMDGGYIYCYAGSTAEANAQKFGYTYYLIDGGSLVYDGQTVEGGTLRLPQSVTAEDFLARASSDGEECEVRLSGLADGKVVNGSTVTLWNNRVDAEGKVYTVRCGDVQVAGDMDNSGIVGLADVTALVRYLAGGWNVTINLNVADVNKDGFVNLKDATLLRRYIAGGWNVELK